MTNGSQSKIVDRDLTALIGKPVSAGNCDLFSVGRKPYTIRRRSPGSQIKANITTSHVNESNQAIGASDNHCFSIGRNRNGTYDRIVNAQFSGDTAQHSAPDAHLTI